MPTNHREPARTLLFEGAQHKLYVHHVADACEIELHRQGRPPSASVFLQDEDAQLVLEQLRSAQNRGVDDAVIDLWLSEYDGVMH